MKPNHGSPRDSLLEKIVSIRGRLADLDTRDRRNGHAAQAEPDYRQIIQLAGCVILCLNPDRTIRFINDYGLQLFGYQSEELLGRDIIGTIISLSDSMGRSLSAMLEDIRRHPEQPVSHENEHVCRDGRTIWISWTAAPLFTAEGELQEVICFGADITRKRAAEQAVADHSAELAWKVKELNCLYDISRIFNQTDADLEPVMQSLAMRLPAGFVHPESTGARIRIADRDFISDHYRESRSKLTSPVISGGRHRGIITVTGQRDKFAGRSEQPFSEQEKDLVCAVAEMAGTFLERWEARQTLSGNEIKYKTLFDSLPQKIFYKDASSVYISCNSNYARELGITPEEIPGKTDYDLFPEELADKFRQDDRRVIETGNLLDMEETSIRDGREIAIHTIKTPVCDAAGRRIGILGIFRDITDRKRMENEKLLIESTLQYNQAELNLKNEINELLLSTRDLHEILHMILIAATANEALGFNRAFLFLMKENDNYLEGMVATGALTINEAYQTWARMAQEPQTLTEIFQSHKRDLSSHDAAITGLVRQIKIPLTAKDSIFTRAVFRQQSFNILSTGELSVFDRSVLGCLGAVPFVLVPLISRGRTLGVLIADNFVTGKTIVEDDVVRLRAFANHASLAIENSRLYESLREKVAELSQANEELSANRDKLIRYERLSVVGEMAAKIAHDIRNPMTAIGGFARRMLKKIPCDAISSSYLQIIVHEVDRLEKILGDILSFSKPAAPRLKAVDLNRLISETYAIMCPELEQRQVRIEKKFDPRLPQVMLDRDQIERVLINLIKNSIEAMPEGGIITATTGLQAQWARIETSDTGQGIAEEDIGKIFEPFYTSKATGSGLGLTLAAQIVSSHGGSMDIFRQEPCGTAVVIHLPIRGPASAETT